MPSLFDRPKPKTTEFTSHEPLAARMRPRTLDEFWGQSHILAKGRLLRRAIEADQLSSVIFYGPPGTGKTTLARIIANTTRSKFLSINAVLAGIKEIRESIETARQHFALVGRRSILFVDEVHRFNKSQQDALLPWVENGTITLIGATTENPYFEVNKALVSRSRVFQLMPLGPEDLRGIAMQALRDEDRGYGLLPVMIRQEALSHLVDVANGDARALLNALELAVETTPRNDSGTIEITLEVAEESIQQRAVLYDKEGDAHFDTISAFIKSVRGSDPDAALYWLARMVQAGESPNFIFRRLLISACEDIGLADPGAVGVVEACAQAFDRIGMPEGRYHLAHATLYLATAPKSNSSMAFFDALSVVQKETSYDVPDPLKDASRDKEGLGHGLGYLYPHAYRDHWVAQQYLPDGLQGRVFYHPTDIGYEATIAEKVNRHREAQIALYEERMASNSPITTEDRWIGRTFDGGAQRTAAVRDEIFAMIHPEANARILDIHAASGLLSFEALRRCPDGGVCSIVLPSTAADNFEALMAQKPELERARIARVCAITPESLRAFPGMAFEGIIGRNFLHCCDDLPAVLSCIDDLLAPGGRAAFANVVPSEMPRISRLMDCTRQLEPKLVEAWRDAEERIIAAEPGAGFTATTVAQAAEKARIDAHLRRRELAGTMTITPSIFSHWFLHNAQTPSYIDKLGQYLSTDACESISHWALCTLRSQNVPWPASYILLEWEKKSPSQPASIATGEGFSNSRADAEVASRAEDEAVGRAEDEAVGRADDDAVGRADDDAACRAEDEAVSRAEDEAVGRAEDEAVGRAEDEAVGRAEDEAKMQEETEKKRAIPMTTVNIYQQYFGASAEYSGVRRNAVDVKLVSESGGGNIEYSLQISFFPHAEPEDFAISYDACFSRVLYSGKGRRAKKREAELMEKIRDVATELATEHGAVIDWDAPLIEARLG